METKGKTSEDRRLYVCFPSQYGGYGWLVVRCDTAVCPAAAPLWLSLVYQLVLVDYICHAVVPDSMYELVR